MSKKLVEIAREMRAAVAAGGWRLVWLPKGLEIGLHRKEERFRLVVRREGVFPSEQEIEIVSQAFGAPVGTEPARRVVLDWSKGYKRSMYVVELGWTELQSVGRVGQVGQMAAAG